MVQPGVANALNPQPLPPVDKPGVVNALNPQPLPPIDKPGVVNAWTPQPLPPTDNTLLGILGADVRRRVSEITDGTSNTVMMAECAGREQIWQMGKLATGTTNGSWANPGNQISIAGFDPATLAAPGACAINCTNVDNVYSFHSGLAMTLFGDGSVKFIKEAIALNIWWALGTKANGEVISSDSY